MTSCFRALAALIVLSAPGLALAQRCDAQRLSDTVCDCGCGPIDPACPAGRFTVCERANCPAGQVPWEHTPQSCMSSACGDGWVDPNAQEVCDDGNALASGGCAADCKSVNPGYTCGERAAGCWPTPDAGTAGGGSAGGAAAGGGGAAGGSATGGGAASSAGGSATAGGGASNEPRTGCAVVPGAASLLTLLLTLRMRRQPRR